MRFIYDYGKVSSCGGIDFIIDDRELLKGGYNDTSAAVKCITQVAGVFALANSNNRADCMVET